MRAEACDIFSLSCSPLSDLFGFVSDLCSRDTNEEEKLENLTVELRWAPGKVNESGAKSMANRSVIEM